MVGTALLRATVLIGSIAALNRLIRARRALHFRFRGKIVVITGGSRGLGLVMARQFAREGALVSIWGRDTEALHRADCDLRTLSDKILPIECDVTKKEDVERAFNQVISRFGRIDVLVNNAGVIQTGPFEAMRTEDFEQSMAVHFRGPLNTITTVLPLMPPGGRIVNISSIGGKVAMPHLMPYTASKFALTGLSDAFRAELRSRKIYVTTVYPGLMRTGSPRNAWFKGQHRKEYAWFAIADSLPILSMNAERAARKILDACRRGDARLVIGVPAKIAVLMNELMPECSASVAAQVNRFLPQASGGDGTIRRGTESESRLSRSFLTQLSREAALRNNEAAS